MNILYTKNKRLIITTSYLVSIWLLLEYYLDRKVRKNLKYISSIKNIHPLDSNTVKTIYNDLSRCQSHERIHLINSMNSTFVLSSPDLNSVYKKLKIFNDKTGIINTKRMLWFPYSLRCFLHLFTLGNLKYYEFFLNRETILLKNLVYVHIFTPKKYKSNKVAIIFLGLGGIIYPFTKIINELIKKDYKIIVPLYGPAQSNLYYNYFYNENVYYEILYDYLIQKKYYNINIFAWSLGGMLYRGFHRYLILKNKINFNSINIDTAYLLEPLLGSRGCIDTYFLRSRNVNVTIDILDSVIYCKDYKKKKKYYVFNRLLAYLFHTIVGFGTANSFNFLVNVEFKQNEKFNYKRYLFLSNNDLIINSYLDGNLIKSNFNHENVYHRIGYHGGWPMSKDLIPILSEIVK